MFLFLFLAASSTSNSALSYLPGWVGAMFAIFGLVGILVTAWNFGNRKRDRDTIDSQDRLLRAVKDESTAKESRCNERIARLEGQVATMVPDFAREIGKALLESMPQFVKAVERAVRERE